MTAKTSPGFWRSFDRAHEALPTPGSRHDGLKTTNGWHGPNVAAFTCATCGMPCHMEHRLLEYTQAAALSDEQAAWDLAFGRSEQNIWVPRHGPAPIRSTHPVAELRGTTPVIEWPDATVMVELDSNYKRHLPDRRTSRKHTLASGYERWSAIPLCGVTTEPQRIFTLGDCWHMKVCGNCADNPAQL